MIANIRKRSLMWMRVLHIAPMGADLCHLEHKKRPFRFVTDGKKPSRVSAPVGGKMQSVEAEMALSLN